MNIRINRIIEKTNVEGFYTRFCIWVQGCSLRCKGCSNSALWNKNSGTLYKTETVIDSIKKLKNEIEGITFLGGEPLEQIEAVLEISKEVKKLNLGIILFTGYELKEIENKKEFTEIKKYIDLLIDGRFIEEKLDYSRPWVGSSNQKYHFLTERYNAKMLEDYKNKIEIRIDKNKNIMLNGMGDYKKVIKTLIN